MKIQTKDYRVREGEEVDLKKRPTTVSPVYGSASRYEEILTNHVEKRRLCRCVRRPQHLAHWVRLLRRGINLEITWFRQSFS